MVNQSWSPKERGIENLKSTKTAELIFVTNTIIINITINCIKITFNLCIISIY